MNVLVTLGTGNAGTASGCLLWAVWGRPEVLENPLSAKLPLCQDLVKTCATQSNLIYKFYVEKGKKIKSVIYWQSYEARRAFSQRPWEERPVVSRGVPFFGFRVEITNGISTLLFPSLTCTFSQCFSAVFLSCSLGFFVPVLEVVQRRHRCP